MVQHGRQTQVIAQGGATRKNVIRVWFLKEGHFWVWSNERGNELTYRQVSQVTDTPDEVKTRPLTTVAPPLAPPLFSLT